MRWHPRPICFLCAEGLLYICFLCVDLLYPWHWLDVPLKYLSILLCLLFAISELSSGFSRLVAAALAFTLLADAFLLVLNRYYLLGILCFCVVQVIYFIRVYSGESRALWPGLGLRLLVALGVLCFLSALGVREPLLLATAVYFTQLLANAVQSTHPRCRYRFFSVGLWLFVCCDLCVGLHNLSPSFSGFAGSVLTPVVETGMWFFYLPSQVLITLSGCLTNAR